MPHDRLGGASIRRVARPPEPEDPRRLRCQTFRLYSSDVAFTPAVKAIQTRKGSRDAYANAEERGGWRTEIDEKLAGFLAETSSFYLATATADGHPYIQHRGGPKGFVKIVDRNTIAFADYSGNRQYITQGTVGKSEGAYFRDGLRPSPARENLG